MVLHSLAPIATNGVTVDLNGYTISSTEVSPTANKISRQDAKIAKENFSLRLGFLA